MNYDQRGPLNHSWKGGRHTDKWGYIMVLAPEHPRAWTNGYVYEHILVVERAMGKHLRRTAQVHHVNEIKPDNRPENLVACDSYAYHTLLHRRARALAECGDANALRCYICHKYDNQPDIHTYNPYGNTLKSAHRSCRCEQNRHYKEQRALARAAS
jgi:hypothetical protein